MAIKPVVEIEVQSAAFDNFQKKFGQFQADLNKQGSAWAKVNQGIKQVAVVMSSLANSSGDLADNTDKSAKSSDKFNKAIKDTQGHMRNLARDTKDVSKNILDATTSLLKWAGVTSVIGGLLGAGGLFGLDRMAMGVRGSQYSSGGLGVRPGELQSARINFSNLVNPESVLGNIADTKSDYSRQQWFGAMGITDFKNKDAAQMLPEILTKARDIFLQGGQNQQYAQARGLTNFLGIEDLRRLAQESPGQLKREISSYQTDISGLDRNKGTTDAWNNFLKQIERAGATIENVFVKGLTPLLPAFESLSKILTKNLASFLTGPTAKGAINDAAAGIDHFAKYLGTQDFKDDMADFADGIKSVAQSIRDALSILGYDTASRAEKRAAAAGALAGVSDPQTRQFLAGIAGQNITAPKANTGLFGDAFSKLGAAFHMETPGAQASRAASRFSDLMKEFHGNRFAAEAAFMFGSKTVWEEMPKNAWKGEYPGGINPRLTSGQQAQMSLIIQNMTNGDVSAQANALGAP